mmetsp:Transcript_20775/g.67249  ORF Transcript_20775/g.67249 Transcript_20775/m.67249 type:complete len:225 (+) Transcript_20775:1848-2522(+)
MTTAMARPTRWDRGAVYGARRLMTPRRPLTHCRGWRCSTRAALCSWRRRPYGSRTTAPRAHLHCWAWLARPLHPALAPAFFPPRPWPASGWRPRYLRWCRCWCCRPPASCSCSRSRWASPTAWSASVASPWIRPGGPSPSGCFSPSPAPLGSAQPSPTRTSPPRWHLAWWRWRPSAPSHSFCSSSSSPRSSRASCPTRPPSSSSTQSCAQSKSRGFGRHSSCSP